jgi:sporulation protein YlmC with PRC-barrel domain
MVKYAKKLIGSQVKTRDSTVGKIKNILFNDENWSIEYFVIGKHKWLPFGKVLVKPVTVKCSNGQAKVITEMTRTEFENCPSSSEYLPVAEQKALEKQIERMGLNKTPAGQNTQNQEQQAVSGTKKDPHLRSIKEIVGYKIQATDGLIGIVNDFVLNPESWRVEGIVVKDGCEDIKDNELIPPDMIDKIIWNKHEVTLNISKNKMLSSLRKGK